MLRDLAEAISITIFRVWKNNIGKGGIKNLFKGGGKSKKRGDYLKRDGDKYPLRTMLTWHLHLTKIFVELKILGHFLSVSLPMFWGIWSKYS